MGLIQRLGCFLLLTILAGCGGGGSLNGDDDGTGGTEPVTVTLTSTDSVKNVSELAPLTITATVMQGSDALANQLVTFTVNNAGLAYFAPAIGTSSTNAQGMATIIIKAGNVAGSGTISATVGSTTSSDFVFDSAGDGNTGIIPSISDISLFASSQQISSDGSQEVTLTAIAKNSGNNLIEGITVQFASDSGQLEIVNSETGPDGKATAILKTESAPKNRMIIATVTSGDVTDTVSVQVVGTTVTLTGSSALALNDETTYIIKMLDSNSIGIAGIDVALSLSGVASTSGGTVANITVPTSVTTDSTGQATVKVTGTTGGSNSIIANALGATTSLPVTVQADSFLFTSFNNGDGAVVNPTTQATIPDVLLSDTVSITLTWLDEGSPVADGTVIQFSTTRGVLGAPSGTTANGQVMATLTSNNSGKALVTFTGTNDNVELNNQIEFEFIAETANTIVAQAFPTSIGPSGQTSTVSVVVRDLAGNLVKNKWVEFNLVNDTSGGVINPAKALTDSNGSASTVYTSNSVSASDGVTIEAVVDGDGTTLSDTVNITIADRAIFIALGTGNDLIEKDSTTYTKQYSVFVTDVDSNPMSNVTLTVSAIPKTYYKGEWVSVYDINNSFKIWAALGQFGIGTKFNCGNEDLNFDGIRDPGEDTNGDGMLTPGNVVAASGPITTDDAGQAIIDIDYSKSYGHWVDVRLVVSGLVSGTESYAQAIFTLPVLASDVNKEDIRPPVAAVGLNGPFGAVASCSVAD